MRSRKATLYSIIIAVQTAFNTAEALYSNITTYDVIDFLSDGHVLLRNIAPELRDAAVMEEHEHAKAEASKAYERYTIKLLECDKTKTQSFSQRIEDGDGANVLKECIDLKLPHGVSQHNERQQMRKIKKPFYQLIDIHDYSELINAIATGERFAAIAADLLQVEKVRLYQTRTFRKVPSADDSFRRLFNHPTYMHTDLAMVPLDTNEYFTIWCPTRDLNGEDSVLTYASGSHRDTARKTWYDHSDGTASEANRRFNIRSKQKDLAKKKICDKPEEPKRFQRRKQEKSKVPRIRKKKGANLSAIQKRRYAREKEEARIEKEFNEINDRDSYRYEVAYYDDIKVGDCVAHHGWLLHGSTSQVFQRGPRDAIAFSYIYGNARKLMSKEDRRSTEFLNGELQDQIMFQKWYYDVPAGEVADHPSLPVVWPQPYVNHISQNTTECETCGSDSNQVTHM